MVSKQKKLKLKVSCFEISGPRWLGFWVGNRSQSFDHELHASVVGIYSTTTTLHSKSAQAYYNASVVVKAVIAGLDPGQVFNQTMADQSEVWSGLININNYYRLITILSTIGV
jgi:hypothetical protein